MQPYRAARRAAAAVAAATLMGGHILAAPIAMAVARPVIDPAALPPDGPPGPSEEMRQDQGCSEPAVVADPNVAQPAPGNVMLNVKQAWQYSTGAGVTVAMIDTGVTPNPRFTALSAGGDFVLGEPNGGLTDCESHGTVVASIIAAAPFNPADRPTPRPAGAPAPALPPPPPANPAPTSAPPPPPKPATVTVTAPPPPPPPAEPPPPDAPAAGGPGVGKQPLIPGLLAGAPDGIVGVAPDAALISIRQSSVAFSPAHPTPAETQDHRKAGDIITLARAIRHAADLPGVRVINVSEASCVNAAAPVDQDALGAAVHYAAVQKDIVIVAAAGNQGDPNQPDCGQNPAFNPLDPNDPRDWAGVRTVVTPAWFDDFVLSVGAVSPDGQPMPDSINGPWVSVAAPGFRIMGLSSVNGAAVNALPDKDPGMGNGFWGTSFSAAYVSGVAALVRAKFPSLTAHQVIRRITATAHNPARGVDNQVGHGVVDPVAALTFDVPPGDPLPTHQRVDARLHLPPPAPRPDHGPRNVALIGGAAVVVLAAVSAAVAAARRRLS
jgi:membrane-anchored mycosin MYCP